MSFSPLVGRNTSYPQNAVGERMKAMLSKDGLTESDFRLPWLHLNVPGAVRFLVNKPENLHWLHWEETTTPGDDREHRSPVECEPSSTAMDTASQEEVDSRSTSSSTAQADSERTQRDQLDISLTFSLPPSCYATSLLHELTAGGYTVGRQ